MSALHCPNPNCTHLFSIGEVRKGAVTCPKCGQVFRFQPPKTPAPPTKPAKSDKPATSSMPTRLDPPVKTAQYPWMVPAMPSAAATPTPAPAKPPYGTPPMAPPAAPPPGYHPSMYPPAAASTPTPTAKPSKGAKPASPPKTEKIVHVRGLTRTRSRNPILKAAVIFVVVAIFLGGAIYGFIHFGKDIVIDPRGPGGPNGIRFQARTIKGFDELALTLNVDKETWSPDKDMKNRVKAIACFKRTDDDPTWFAIAIQDFGFRNPREAELINGAIDRLRPLYGDTLQINSAKPEPVKVNGIDGVRCAFTGKTNINWGGECYLIAHHGFAYWILIAGPSVEAAQQHFADLESQNAISLTTDRKGWTEQPPELETFASRSNTFMVRTPEKVWVKHDPLTYDEMGEMYLAGVFQPPPGQPKPVVSKNADVICVALELKVELRDAYKEALAYFEKKKQDESKDYAFEPVAVGAHLKGEECRVGEQPGWCGEAKLVRGKEAMRYLMIAVFNDGTKTYAFRFDCQWDLQAIWKREFEDILKTVRLIK